MADDEEEKETNYIGLIIFLCTLPVIMLFSHFGLYELGMNIAISLFTLLFAVGICWELKKQVWFWLIVVLLLTFHVLLALRIHWPPHVWVSKIILLPILLADLAFDVGVIRFIENLIVKPLRRLKRW